MERQSPELVLTADSSYLDQWPLAPIDDHMIHQTTDPIRIMWTSDARTYERYWTTVQDRRGDLIMVVGGGFYPSLGTAEAYAIINYKGIHTSVRAFRSIGADRMNLHIGPIKPTIIQGLRTWRYVLDENEYGISFDFLWHDTKRQDFGGPGFGRTAPAMTSGRQSPNATAGFDGFGVAEGWVNFHGERIELTTDQHHGSRDRHWGVRDGVGGPPHWIGERPRNNPFGVPGPGGGQRVDFGDWGLWSQSVVYPLGDPRPRGRVTSIDRKLRFEPDTHLFLEGIITNTFDSGEVKEIHYRRVGNQIAFLRCGMYDGTPDKGIEMGMQVGNGELVVEGETYDTNIAEVRGKLIGNDCHQCDVTIDGRVVSGMFEPHEPGAYEYCRDGAPGWSLLT